MGKKSSSKIASAGPTVPVVPTASKDEWLDSLREEDRKFAVSLGCSNAVDLEREKKKLEERTKKAEEAQKKQLWQNQQNQWWENEKKKEELKKDRENRKWQQLLDATKKQAFKEGVLEAQDFGDGSWWVQLDSSTWKEVQGQYYCTLCNKHLNDSTLQSHIESKAHQNKLWYLTEAESPSTDGVSQPSKAAQKSAQPSEPDKSRYTQPDLPYLAWVPFDESNPNGERWLKCLLCNKWCQDDSSHSGPSGSKEHQKNLRNYGPGDPWYEANVVRQRLKYHPMPSPTVSVPPAAGPPAESPKLAPWACPFNIVETVEC